MLKQSAITLNSPTSRKVKQNEIAVFSTIFIFGFLVGAGYFPAYLLVMGAIYVLLGLLCVFFALQNNLKKILILLPYLIYLEVYIRSNDRQIPYSYVQYIILIVFLLLMLHTTKFYVHSKSFFFLIFFAIIEIIESYNTHDVIYSKFLITNSILLAVISVWSCFNFLTPNLINIFLQNLKYASMFLCAVVVARHFIGHIDYSTQSNSTSTNGMAPVQISGYLGFSCAVFFLSIMNNPRSKELIINIALLAINAIVMILSFSRGGIYFLGAFIMIYIFFNRTKIRNYFLFLLLTPVAMGVYYYVSAATNGLIEERYQQQGSSGRNLLVQAGYELFLSEPLTGVGTANFNTEIIKQDLYQIESGAHNEFIRVAAEHGVPGVILFWGFFIYLMLEIARRRKVQKEYAIYFLMFFIMITIHNGLKISLQPILLLLAIATPSLKRVKNKNVYPEAKLIA